VTGFTFSLVNNGNTPSVTVHWKTFNDGNLVDDNSAGISYDVQDSNTEVPVLIGSGSEFDTVEVWFDDLGTKDVRIQNFSLQTSIIAEDEPLHFEVAAIDGDGDITADVGFEVLMQGGAGPDYTVSGNSEILAGSDGNDDLIGGVTDQLLFGGDGDDILFGDDGADVFAYNGLTDEGSDTITDFDLGEDALRFYDVVDVEEDIFLGNVTLTANSADNSDVILTTDAGTSITIEGINVNSGSGGPFDGYDTLGEFLGDNNNPADINIEFNPDNFAS
jgi:Ca2+-binding RTX toxin-like protein